MYICIWEYVSKLEHIFIEKQVILIMSGKKSDDDKYESEKGIFAN